MRFAGPLIVVADMERSKRFYEEVLGQRIAADFGANVTLEGGVSLQTKESWIKFIQKADGEIAFSGNDAELYFEEDDFDGFLRKIGPMRLPYVHPALEHGWGQRVVRFYDPDGHIIEVGESMRLVVRRFANGGMNETQIAGRMGVPQAYVRACLEAETGAEG